MLSSVARLVGLGVGEGREAGISGSGRGLPLAGGGRQEAEPASPGPALGPPRRPRGPAAPCAGLPSGRAVGFVRAGQGKRPGPPSAAGSALGDSEGRGVGILPGARLQGKGPLPRGGCSTPPGSDKGPGRAAGGRARTGAGLRASVSARWWRCCQPCLPDYRRGALATKAPLLSLRAR